MSELEPWEEAKAAQDAANPATPPQMEPWEEVQSARGIGSSPMQASPATKPEPSFMDTVGQAAKNALVAPAQAVGDLATNPVTMAKALPYASSAALGMMMPYVGNTVGMVGGRQVSNEALRLLGHEKDIPSTASQVTEGMAAGAADLVGPATSLFKTPESLKSAGISATTLEHMAPGGQEPEAFVKAVEQQFKNEGVLANSPNDTWKLMYPESQKVGEAIKNDFLAIKQAGGPEALMVDAKKALDPIANEALKRGTGLFSKTENLANPFYDAYDGLNKIAQQQGGKLTIDNLDMALKETGQIMDEGGEATKGVFSKLYGKLADARDVIVNNVANQSGNQALKQSLLQNNARYSTYMRVLPSIEKAAFRDAIKEGVSAYQKYVGPLGEKLMAAGGMYGATRSVIDKILGNQ